MNNTKQFKLINGMFKPEDARIIVQNLYSEKIRFHNCQLLHIMETQKGDRQATEAKLAELKEASNAIDAFLQSQPDIHSMIEVKGMIEINLTPSC